MKKGYIINLTDELLVSDYFAKYKDLLDFLENIGIKKNNILKILQLFQIVIYMKILFKLMQ